MTLRSNLEPGSTSWAVRRAQWSAMGISHADMEKPKVAIINSSSALSVCFSHLDGLTARVKQAVSEAGGLAFEIRTAAPSDFVTSAGREARYILPSRDLIVNDIEVAVEGALLDGMVCLASCDKTTPGHLMAAGRLNVPTVVVIGGYQSAGTFANRSVDIDDVYEAVGAVAAGHMAIDELGEMADQAIVGPGVCAGLGTANTMHVLCEALGMALPGSAPVRAGSRKMAETAERSGHRVVEMIASDLRPRQIMTADAFENAVTVDIALGGSINSVRHLQAIAVECGLDIDVFEILERRARRTPLLCSLRPNGAHRTEDLERAGGTLGLMKQLESELVGGALNVAGCSVGELLATAIVHDADVIRPLSSPLDERPGLCLVRGSLAPDGALVKLAAVAPDRLMFTGAAKVFATGAEAIAALGRGAISAGDVVVMAGLGPKGGPGTVFAADFVAALNGAGIAADVAVVTDGELSGLNRGLTIGQVMPEAAEGGPLALVRNGDRIKIDLVACAVDLEVAPAEVAARRSNWQPPEHTEAGWLGQYAQLVQPLSRGAVLGARDGRMPRTKPVSSRVAKESEDRARALELMLGRVDKTATEPPAAGFPHYADQSTGEWVRSPFGDWTGGFWNGELWLAAQVTGDERYVRLGREWAFALRPRAKSETVFRGFLFWYGAALGSVLHGDDVAGEVAIEGARALAGLFNREAQVIPLGSEAEEASDVGRDEANIDGVPGGTPLLIWAARRAKMPELEDLARTHVRRHIDLCVRQDGSVCQSASFDPSTGLVRRRYTHKGVRDDSTWTRAQAWAMLGFAQAVCAGASEFSDVAVRVSDWWCEHLPKGQVASWDFDDPEGPLDTSGTAIAAASLLKLAAAIGYRGQVYAETATSMVHALIDGHLTGMNQHDNRPPGMLADGCYNRRIGLATANELIWGDYFLFEALAALEGRLNIEEV